MLVNISLEEAYNQILQYCQPLDAESIPIMTALGRVSAVDLHAPADLPVRQQSAVDGYALCAVRTEYRLIGKGKPGEIPTELLLPGQALAVCTGGNLPGGTTAVIPHEKTEISGQSLYPREEIKPGNNIKQAGEDFPADSLMASQGSIVGAGEIGLLAAFGMAAIEVYRRPRVAVLCLSENVVEWQKNPQPGQMRDSNSPMLSSLVIRDGGIPVGGCTSDNIMDSLQEAAERLLGQCDILIITGGTYADGESEAASLMGKLGAEIIFWDVSVQPGSHIGFALKHSKQIFALSGNPAACSVGYHLFVAPALRGMQGYDPGYKRISAICSNGFPKKAGTRRFVRGQLTWTEKGWQITVLPGQKPSMIRSLLQCNALIDLPAGSPPVDAGQEVVLIVLESVKI
ncbi:MAG TPA: molybdopterin molybdotransferase MoeA [Syntrophomonas sp.]|nr:molybdopterin molybdotransferase MoeA [Syntrophomonas sp.]HRW12691.1 molybdopterin molybdotransferase MoeA [Syntrophomonas sp.]